MRLAVLGAFVIVVGAGLLNIVGVIGEASGGAQLATTVALTASVAVQRLNGVQKWLTAPTDHSKDQAERLAQQTLIRLCDGRPVAEEILQIRVHVWAVPTWYRRAFPYSLRTFLRNVVRKRGLKWLAWFKIRPKLRRLAAIGLIKEPPSGVPFRMGKGLIGVCLLNNDRGETLKLRTSDTEYRAALQASSEKDWESHGPEITHNLSLHDARKLAHLYGQVISKVVQDPRTGEAIGCVTISIKDSNPRIGSQVLYLNNLRDLALTVSDFA